MLVVKLDVETYLRWLTELGDLWAGYYLPQRRWPVTARRTTAKPDR